MAPVSCTQCMDAGYVLYDGVPRSCGNCPAGAEHARTGGGIREELDPRRLPPGGELIIRERQREEAGIPPGVIGSDVLVRATIEAEPIVHALVRLLCRVVTTEQPTSLQATIAAAIGELPPWAVPDDVTKALKGELALAAVGGGLRDPRASSPAAPLTAPDGA